MSKKQSWKVSKWLPEYEPGIRVVFGETIIQLPSCVVNTIEVESGELLSLQYHDHRSERWVFVAGSGNVTIESVNLLVERGTHVCVPCETKQ